MQDVVAALSLAASVASLTLAVLAIWIALYGKREADHTHQETRDLLTEVRSDAKSIAQVAMPELRAYGESVRRYVFKSSGSSDNASAAALEHQLSTNLNGIRSELEELRAESDVTAIRKRLSELETEIEESSQDLRDSVGYVPDVVSVSTPRSSYTVDLPEWPRFMRYFLREEALEKQSYGREWRLESIESGEILPTELVFGSGERLKELSESGIVNLLLMRLAEGSNT